MGCKVSKWQDKSNEEINIAVTGHRFNCSEWGMNQSKSTFFYDDKGAGVGGKVIVLDYCREWGFAGPLIQENHITIAKHKELSEWWAFGGGYEVDYDLSVFSSVDCEHAHANPLRAAMIVYLEMNGVQPNE